MAIKKKIIKAGYQTYPGNTSEKVVPNTDLLPGVHRTTRNKKYLDALLGELTSKGTLESFDGWVGSRTGRVRRKDDIYLNDRSRLTVGIKANDIAGDLTDIAEELTNRENVPFKDAKQMASGTSYGYSPGIDPDKFVNFQNYYWLRWDLPEIMLDAGFNDDGSPADVSILEDIIGKPYYTTKTQTNGRRLTLRNGMKLYFVERGNGNWIDSEDFVTVPSDSLDPKYYVVSGVGHSISLLEYSLYQDALSPISILAPVPWDRKNWDSTRWDTDVLTPGGKQYVTIKVGSDNYNAWSRSNRWIHEQTAFETARYLDIESSLILFEEDRAARPIVEFNCNMDLWNHGHLGKRPVDLLTNSVSSLIGLEGTANPVIDGVALAENSRVIFSGGDPAIRNKTFVVIDVATAAQFLEDDDNTPVTGESVLVRMGPNFGLTYWFNGEEWTRAQQLTSRGQAPLFRLFDKDGIPIEDYDTAAFSGSKIFGYLEGTTNDRELGFSIAYDSSYKGSLKRNVGAIRFKNYLSNSYQKLGDLGELVNIDSANFFREWNVYNNLMWDYSPGWQPVSKIYNVNTSLSTIVSEVNEFGHAELIGPQWVWEPTYEWNISVPKEIFNNNTREFLVEEVLVGQPYRAWHDELLFARYKDNTIHNLTGQRIRIANQRGEVFVDTTDILVVLPKELFGEQITYDFGDILLTDDVVKWKIGESRWHTGRILDRRRDDPRRHDVYVNGQLRKLSGWRTLFEGADNETPATGILVRNVNVGDIIDVIANGSMRNSNLSNTNITNLTNNPYNEDFVAGAYGQMFEHFVTAIKKRAIPRFVDDINHQSNQTPRFDQVEGDGLPFGDNDWQFAQNHRPPVGHTIVKHDAPALRYFWAMKSGEVGGQFTLLEDARRAYANFKLKFIQKIEQLNKDQDITDVQAAVDKALSEIFVGRNQDFRYAKSHMVMWGAPDYEKIYTFSGAGTFVDGGDSEQTLVGEVDGGNAGPNTFEPPALDGEFAPTPIEYVCEIPGADTDLNEICTDHVYVYYKHEAETTWRILTYTGGYDIDFETKTVRISGDFDYPCQFKIRVFKKTRNSFVPPTPAKLGIMPWFHPAIVTDDTYQSGPVKFIQGHDGSLTRAWSQQEGAFLNDMLLEFERRVATSIGIERGERAELLLNKFFPRKGRRTWYNRVELNNYLEDSWLTWAHENNIVDQPNDGYVAGRPLTYNYSAMTAADGNRYGSWRDIYRHVYGTDRPHTHPWEMLGFARKPTWWDSRYSWSDPAKRISLIRALETGERSADPSIQRDTVSWLSHDSEYLSGPDAPFAPVDNTGALRNPVQAGWYTSQQITDNADTLDDAWIFGNKGPYEMAWRRSSEYRYALATWLLLSAGPEYIEEVWEGPRLTPSPLDSWVRIDRTYENIIKWSTANQHRETGADVVPGYGMLVNEFTNSLNASVLLEKINEIRNIVSRLQWTAYNFIDPNSLDFIADILIEQEKGNRIPQENYRIGLKITSPSTVLTYSGVKVISVTDELGQGYKISGYDNINTYFPYNPVDTQGLGVTVNVGTLSYKKFTQFLDQVEYLDYGTVMRSRQDVVNFLLGYENLLKQSGWVFDDVAPTNDDILDWSYSCREFVTWSQTRWQPNTQIALSPASQNLVLAHDTRFFGRLDTTFLSRTYLLDENENRIEFKDTEVIRGPSSTVIKSRPGVGIYFVRCGLEEYTHVVTFDDTTIFNDQINDYLFGQRILRMRAQGKRTKSWNGRPSGLGYVIQEDGLISNFDTISRELGDDYITVENRSANPWIRNLKKSQLGLTRPEDALLTTGFSKDTIDQFQSAGLRRKGTPNIVEKFTKGLLGKITNPKNLPYDPAINIRENWMFRMGEDIGNTGEKTVWEIKIPPGSRDTLMDLITLRFIPPFRENTYYEALTDRAADNIIDILGPKDRRWVRYPRDFALPLRSKAVTEEDLPQAGIPDRLETDYKFMDVSSLYEIDLTNEEDPLYEAASINSWSSKLAYDQGDRVRYKGQLYEAAYSHLASTEFLPDQWTAIEELLLPSIWLANKTEESNDIKDWTVLQTMDKGLAIRELCAGTAEDPYHPLVEMESGAKHGLVSGDWVLILSTEKSELNGFYKVTKIRDSEAFFIELRANPFDFVAPEFPPGNTSAGGKLLFLKQAHFYTVEEMRATVNDPSYEWRNTMKAYVDDRINEPRVFEFRGNYTLFDDRPQVNRAAVFEDLSNNNVIHQYGANIEENMPWLFAIGSLLATFKALDAGDLALTDMCPVSLAALAVPEPKFGTSFATVPEISVQNAINGIIFRQFNDCAWILAEKIYGNINDAVAAINTLFDEITAFSTRVDVATNGSGTTLDLAKIAKALWSYTSYQSQFAQTSWFYRGVIYDNKNKLLDYDGIGIMALRNYIDPEDQTFDPLNPEQTAGYWEFHTLGVKAFAERELLEVLIGYQSVSRRNADAVAFLETINSFGNVAGTFNQIPFVFDRRLNDIVDHKRITKVEIVDYKNNRVLAELSPYDPAAGIIPQYVDQFINWKEHDDPASYTNSDLDEQDGYSVRPRFAWYSEHVGEVWWDLSAVRYFDYYQGNTRERAFGWGKQFPGSKIDVYEWVKSSVPPAQWAESSRTGFLVDFETVTGVPYHKLVGDEKKYFWCEREEKDPSGALRTYYYFWVSGLDRSYTSRRIIRTVNTNVGSGGSSVSYSRAMPSVPTTSNRYNVTQLASVINDPRVAGARWFAGLQGNAIMLSGISKLLGQEGAVLRIEVDGNEDQHSQWLLLKEKDPTSIVSDWLHIRLRDSLLGTDQTEVIYETAPYANGQAYLRGQVVLRNGNYYRAFRDFLPTDVAFGDGSPVAFEQQPWQRIWDYRQVTTTSIGEIQGKDVPNYNRHPYDRYGNEIRPSQQSWLRDRLEAIRILVDVANRELLKFNVVGVQGWDDRLARVITTNDPNFSYDVSKYWRYVDYLEDTFDPNKEISLTVDVLSELYDVTSAQVGDYVKVLRPAEQAVNVWEKLTSGWKLVYQQNGTIQLNDNLFDLAKKQDTWDSSPWDSLRWDSYPFVELFEIITALREDVFVDVYQVHYNVVFFALVREVLRQNPVCHWIRKTTYLDVERISSDEIIAHPYFRKEFLRNDDDVLKDFVNEVKPYHSKILNQIEVDQLLEQADINIDDSHKMKIVLKYGRHGEQTWQGYHIDGHPFNHLLEGWGRNPWEFEFTAEGLLPSSGERVSRLKKYLWDMPQADYEALIDTVVNGYTFGLVPEELQAIIEGNRFYQPDWDKWPEEMVSLSPGESVEIRVINNRMGSTIDADTVAWRYHMDILGGLRVYRYNDAATTTLAQMVGLETSEIELANATVLTRPDPANGKPGVVWVARERMEFWEIDGNIIKGVVRGTLGTPVLEHPAGRRAYDGGQQNQVPTPEGLKNWYDALYPAWNELGKTLLDSDTREALFLKDAPGSFVP